jgi:hypothetical protein
VSTLYCRSDTATVNGLSAYKLLETNGVADYTPIAAATYAGGSGDSQVAIRASGGSETVIGAYPVAASAVDDGTFAEFSATWSCPATTIGATDSLVVRNRITGSEGNTVGAWGTAQGPGSLTATTWTFYRTMAADGFGEGATRIYFGGPSCPTRIEGITFGGGAATVYPIWHTTGVGIGTGISTGIC